MVVSITTAVAGLGWEVENPREIARRIEDWHAELDGLVNSLVALTCRNCTTNMLYHGNDPV